MDTDFIHEGHSEVGGDDSSADDDMKVITHHKSENESNVIKKSMRPSFGHSREMLATEVKDERWVRLQSHYSDQYLSLFNESSVDGIDVTNTDLESTRIGLIDWSKLEKEQFFLALSRRSKADVRGIATSIGSKSELEVYEYLLSLEEEGRSTRQYGREVNDVSHADIPAATELSSECEALLEQAADALTVYQEKYDRAIGEQVHGNHWLIDHVQAHAYDMLIDQVEEGDSSEDSPSNTSRTPAGGLFKLSSWLSLTERVFMNSDPSRNENNWATHAAREEMLAITQGAISDLYELALYHLRKVMQTSIFCAESRIRSIKGRGHTVKALVREQDVGAAINTLGLQEDHSKFWLGLARRNQLRVVDDHGDKGSGRERLLNYDEVERILGQTSVPKRGRRSMSSSSKSSSILGDADHFEEVDIADSVDDTDAISTDQPAEQPSFEQKRQKVYSPVPADIEISTNPIYYVDDNVEPSHSSSNEESLSISEDDQDHQLELLDQVNNRHHELRLCHDLGWAMPGGVERGHFEGLKINEEMQHMTEHGTEADLINWRDSISSYVEAWEEHGQGPDEARFVENRKHTKRRRTNQGTGKQEDLLFRVPDV